MDLQQLQQLPTRGQLIQDLWVLAMTGSRSGGFFLEIGSADGVDLNNTVLLEREFSWRGVCVEPNPTSFAFLTENRTCICVNKAAWRTSNENVEFIPRGLLGAITDVAFGDAHSPARRRHMATHGTIQVETISIGDLCETTGVPALFEYLSLDVEGAELAVLTLWDFDRWRFALATVEHNGSKQTRGGAWGLLAPLGYRRVQMGFEDWFYHPELLQSLNGGLSIDYDDVTKSFLHLHQARVMERRRLKQPKGR